METEKCRKRKDNSTKKKRNIVTYSSVINTQLPLLYKKKKKNSSVGWIQNELYRQKTMGDEELKQKTA